jgi:hypothetical protein
MTALVIDRIGTLGVVMETGKRRIPFHSQVEHLFQIRGPGAAI